MAATSNAFVCASCRTLCTTSKSSGAAQAATRWKRWASTARARPMRLAIIGSGPAGYYVAYRIMKRLPTAFVDMFESLPTPYGLVRFGVAPDHPEVKKSSENLDDVAKWSNFNFVGNVPIGNEPHSLPLPDLAAHYDGVVFAYGASRDKKLGLAGEELHGVYSARAFVGWYNGLPEFKDLKPDLQQGDTAVVLGQGNVALDVARVLLSPVDHLRHTDIAEHALETLRHSKISRVSIVGRRGPLQAPATIKEIRELMNIERASYQQPVNGWGEHIGVLAKTLPRQMKRIMDLLTQGSKSQAVPDKTWMFRYLLSPVEFKGNAQLDSIVFEQMRYKQPMKDRIEAIMEETKDMAEWERGPAILNRLRSVQVEGTGESKNIPTSTAFRSIGYLSEPLDGMRELGIQFDESKGIIPNDIHGRVLSSQQGPGDLTAAHVPGMYCAGWVKRGPTGVIASTLDDAFRTADIVIDDWNNGVPFNKDIERSDKLGLDGLRAIINRKNIRPVGWSDWEKIDTEEKSRGRLKDKPREKIVDRAEMLKIIE